MSETTTAQDEREGMSDTMTISKIRELLELERAATPGEWRQDCQPLGPCGTRVYGENIYSSATYPHIEVCRQAFDTRDRRQEAFDSMVLIAAQRNALRPLLVSLLESWYAEISHWIVPGGAQSVIFPDSMNYQAVWASRGKSFGALTCSSSPKRKQWQDGDRLMCYLTDDGQWLLSRAWETPDA